jgi:hypothetical protein
VHKAKEHKGIRWEWRGVRDWKDRSNIKKKNAKIKCKNQNWEFKREWLQGLRCL